MGKDSGVTGRIFVAFFAGAFGGYIGTPPDKVNVRMQNDVALPHNQRLKYSENKSSQDFIINFQL